MEGPQLTRENLVGFWKIYDSQVADDALSGMAAGGEPRSIFSAPIVLRADGQTSRGSDFPGGEWSVEDEVSSKTGETLRRVQITLRSRRIRQEWRYVGLAVGVQLPSLRSDGEEAAAAEAVAGDSSSPSAAIDLRVVGQSSRWDVADPSAPKQLGETTSFSMVKTPVDRRKLIPTIRPLSLDVDPEEVRSQSEWRRRREQSEEDEIRQAIEDVRRAKRDFGDGWREADRLVEGRDFWKVSEAPEQDAGMDAGSLGGDGVAAPDAEDGGD
jgi:hypothetical protein